MIKCVCEPCLLGPCPGTSCKFYKAPEHVSEERLKELSAECEKGTIRPFYCGTQYMDWESKNCGHCRKSAPADAQHFTCELEYCLSYACFGAGTVSEGIAARIGYNPATEVYLFKCREFEEK